MKRIALFIIFTMAMTIAQAQDSTRLHSSKEKQPKLVSAQTLKKLNDGTIVMEKDVKLQIDDQLELEAGRVTYNRETRVLIAEDMKRLMFKGSLIFSGTSTGRCRYVVGEKEIYVE